MAVISCLYEFLKIDLRLNNYSVIFSLLLLKIILRFLVCVRSLLFNTIYTEKLNFSLSSYAVVCQIDYMPKFFY